MRVGSYPQITFSEPLRDEKFSVPLRASSLVKEIKQHANFGESEGGRRAYNAMMLFCFVSLGFMWLLNKDINRKEALGMDPTEYFSPEQREKDAQEFAVEVAKAKAELDPFIAKTQNFFKQWASSSSVASRDETTTLYDKDGKAYTPIEPTPSKQAPPVKAPVYQGSPKKQRVSLLFSRSHQGVGKAAEVLKQDSDFYDDVIDWGVKLGIADPSWPFIVMGGETDSYDPTATGGIHKNNPTVRGMNQMTQNTLYDVIKNCPEDDDAVYLLKMFNLDSPVLTWLKSESFKSEEDKLRAVRGWIRVKSKSEPEQVKALMKDLHEQYSNLSRKQQFSVGAIRTDMQMKRLGWETIETLPEYIMLQVLPAYADDLRAIWDNSRVGSHEQRLQKILSYVVADTRGQGKHAAVYWQNPAFSGANVTWAINKNGKRYMKKHHYGPKKYFTVGDMLNHYYATSFPNVKEGSYMQLAPIAQVSFSAASQLFESQFGKPLPIISALRSAHHHKKVYDQLDKAPFLKSAHLYGYALDLSFKALTAEEISFAIALLSKFGFHRPFKHRNGEANHFEFQGIQPDSGVPESYPNFMTAYQRALALMPTIAVLPADKNEGVLQPFYLIPPKAYSSRSNNAYDISKTPDRHSRLAGQRGLMRLFF